MTVRLFIAIPFPPELCDRLTDVQAQLRAQGIQGNYSRRENFHLTLAFLGETSRQRDIQRAMAAASDAAFPITIGGLGHFGDLFWAGIRPSPALSSLAGALQGRLRELGFPLERRPFRPHITLVREANPPRLPPVRLPETSMLVDRMVLMESSRIQGRLTYTPLFETRLQPGGRNAPPPEK